MQKTENNTKAVDSNVKVNLPVYTKISKNNLVVELMGQKGATFIQLHSTTEPKMNKGGRECSNTMFGKVVKDSITNCIVGFSYENMVNNALNKEFKMALIDAGFDPETVKTKPSDSSSFVAAKRQWGEHMVIDHVFDIESLEWKKIRSKTLIQHEKEGEKRFYLQVGVLGSETPVYRYKDSGEVLSDVDLEIVKSYIPTTKEGERQGLDKPIVVRDYRVDNVKKIHINKNKYVLNN